MGPRTSCLCPIGRLQGLAVHRNCPTEDAVALVRGAWDSVPCGHDGAIRDGWAAGVPRTRTHTRPHPGWQRLPPHTSARAPPYTHKHIPASTRSPMYRHTHTYTLFGKGNRSCLRKQIWKGSRRINEAGSWETISKVETGRDSVFELPVFTASWESGLPRASAHRHPPPPGCSAFRRLFCVLVWDSYTALFVPLAGECPVGEGSDQL